MFCRLWLRVEGKRKRKINNKVGEKVKNCMVAKKKEKNRGIEIGNTLLVCKANITNYGNNIKCFHLKFKNE